MQELRSIETNILVDMLAAYTTEYLRLTEEPGKQAEYAKCVLTVKAIQSEIESRRQSRANNNTDPTIII
jgi:hypothetical protein